MEPQLLSEIHFKTPSVGMPHVPQVPRDIWQRIEAVVVEKPHRLHMGCWHSRHRGHPYHKNTYDYTMLYSEELTEEIAHSCNTAHCIAGFIAAFTPGGITLTKELYTLDDRSRLFELYGIAGQNNEIEKTIHLRHPPALSAILILKTRPELDVDVTRFWDIKDSERSLAYIKQMALAERILNATENHSRLAAAMQKIYEKPESAFTHELPTYEGIDDPDEP